MQHQALRKEMIETAQAMNACGLNHGNAGNLSQRIEEGFLITPTGIAYDHLQSDQIVFIDEKGDCSAGQYRPSSEWRFHHDLYLQRSEIEAIIHVHSTYATVLACHRKFIPSFHYMIAEAGGDTIRCADYATFGSQELSDKVCEAMEDRKACLLANHGMIAMGKTLKQTLKLTQAVEELAKQYVLSLQLGEPVILAKQEMEIIIEKFKTYGEQNAS